MKSTKMKPGYYHLLYSGIVYIVYVPSIEGNTAGCDGYMYANNSYMALKSKDFCDLDMGEWKEATPEEIRHFEACKEAGHYVSLPEIINYEIY